MKRADVTGQRFGRLSVTGMVYGGASGSVAECRCDCGQPARVLAYNLKSGNTSSCGCAAREAHVVRGLAMAPLIGAANRTHGHTTGGKSSPTYVSWSDAKKRCYSPQNKRFADYGARGIRMCDAWRESFEKFLSDMGERPAGKTLDRREVDGHYERDNCRWATRTEQAQNQRKTIATPGIVAQMRARREAGESVRALAVAYGMSRSNAEMILTGKTWKNV